MNYVSSYQEFQDSWVACPGGKRATRPIYASWNQRVMQPLFFSDAYCIYRGVKESQFISYNWKQDYIPFVDSCVRFQFELEGWYPSFFKKAIWLPSSETILSRWNFGGFDD